MIHTPEVRFLRLPHADGLPLPSYATPASAGMDLLAAIDTDMVLQPGGRTLVPTGLCMAIPEGYEGQVRARSGRAVKEGLGMPNAPGTIDADYRGELKVALINFGQAPIVIRRGERIAQLVIAPVARAMVREVTALEETERGHGGFGSTGR